MRILSWIQNKMNGRREKSASSSSTHRLSIHQNTCKEEFGDWPQAFFSIGTLGNDQGSSQEASDLNVEELIKLLKLKLFNGGSTAEDGDAAAIVLNRAKELLAADGRNAIGRTSIPFLLEKFFASRSGFAPQPSLRDPLHESGMEKILRKILHKKIHPQRSSRAATKKFLRSGGEEQARNGSKWVKTDSEYIVLEI